MNNFEINCAGVGEICSNMQRTGGSLSDSSSRLRRAARELSGQRGFGISTVRSNINYLAQNTSVHSRDSYVLAAFLRELERNVVTTENRTHMTMTSATPTKKDSNFFSPAIYGMAQVINRIKNSPYAGWLKKYIEYSGKNGDFLKLLADKFLLAGFPAAEFTDYFITNYKSLTGLGATIGGIVGGVAAGAVSGGGNALIGLFKPGADSSFSVNIPGYKDGIKTNGDNSEKGYLASIKGEVEGYLGSAGAKYESDYVSGEATVKVGRGIVQGKAEAVLFKDGAFDPSLDVEASVEVQAIHGKAEGKLGSKDINLYGEAEGAIGVAEAGFDMKINKNEVKVGGEAGFAVAKGEAKAGFNLFGLKIELTGEAELLGVGVGGKFEKTSNSVEVGGKLSFLGGLGLNLKVSWK